MDLLWIQIAGLLVECLLRGFSLRVDVAAGSRGASQHCRVLANRGRRRKLDHQQRQSVPNSGWPRQVFTNINWKFQSQINQTVLSINKNRKRSSEIFLRFQIFLINLLYNRIARNSNKYQLRTSPSNGTASLTTPFLHCTASLGQTSHLFVRRGERRMHYDGTSFIVRNAGHSAGFDDNNQLKVY